MIQKIELVGPDGETIGVAEVNAAGDAPWTSPLPEYVTVIGWRVPGGQTIPFPCGDVIQETHTTLTLCDAADAIRVRRKHGLL